MRRRDFIVSTIGATAAWPLLAQPAKVRTVGVLVRAAPGWQRFSQLFPGLLRERGYVEGQNMRFEFRSDEGDIARLPELATELVRLKVDVIVTWFTPAATAAKRATHEIPIVCAVCGDMVGTGLVASLARPGGNVTGISAENAEASGKSVELMRELLPSARRIAALANAPDPFSKSFLRQVQLAGDATATAINPIMVHRAEELDAAFSAMAEQRPDAVIVQPSLPTKHAAQLALAHRLPTACAFREFASEGGLVAFSGAEADIYRRASFLVDKVLRGARPVDIPTEQPTKFELVINLKTAKALGLSIPQLFLQRADEVIE